MAKVVLGITMSLDGFINDRDGKVGRLYPDLSQLRTTELLQDSIKATGAVVMGRHAYDMAQGDFTGYEYQVPIFVLTHRVPEKTAKGENGAFKFNFVTESLKSAVEQAKAAAGNRTVTIIGGADTAQQCLKSGLVDELHIGIIPILLGDGLRFFEHLGTEPIQLETIEVIDSPGRTDFQYRVVR